MTTFDPNTPETKVPAIPDTSDVQGALRALKELVEVREGVRGNKLDSAVTWRDLVRAQIAMLTINGQVIRGTGDTGLPFNPGPGGGGGDEEVDLTPPPQPTGLSALGALTSIILDWDVPAGYTNLAYTEVWRATDGLLANAVMVGTTSGYLYTDAVGPGSTTYTYWVRFVSKADVRGQYSSGVNAQTSSDPTALLDLLTGQIGESQLNTELGERITTIGTLQDQMMLLSAGIGEQFDSAKIWYFDTGIESWGGNGTPTTVGGWLRAADHATDAYVTSPSGAVNGAAYPQVKMRIRKVGAPVWEGYLWWRATPSAWDLGSRVAFAEPAFDANDIATVTVNAPWTGTIDSIRLDLSAASNAVDRYELDWVAIGRAAPGASVLALQQEASVRQSETGALFAKYTVKIDNNGYVSGYGLASEANNSAPLSTFAVRADRFYIASPSGPGIDPAMPFVVTTTSQVINGITIPPGAYLTDAYIKRAVVNTFVAGLAVIDNASIVSMNAAKILAGALGVGQYIESQGYIAGSQGWRIRADGVAEFSNAVVRGTVYASTGAIGGLTIDANGVHSNNYVAGSTGFQLKNDGSAEINNMVARGQVKAAVLYGGSYGPNYTWPNPNTGGFHLSASGLLVGNYNGTTGTYAYIQSNGVAGFSNVYARGNIEATSIKAGSANIIDTLMLQGQAVTFPGYNRYSDSFYDPMPSYPPVDQSGW